MAKKIRNILLFLVSAGLIFLLLVKFNLLCSFCAEPIKSQTSTEDTKDPQIEDNTFGYTPELSTSHDKKYVYLLTSVATSDKCLLNIFKNDTPVDTESILGFSEVNCSSSMGFRESDVRGWIGDSILSIYRLNEYKKMEIVSYDLNTDHVYKYQPKNSNLVLYTHSGDLSNFLFADNQANKYYISNSDETVMSEINLDKIINGDYTLTKIIFDPFNDTYLIITQKQTEVNGRLYPGYISYQISAVSERDLVPKIVYNSPNIEIFHPMDQGATFTPLGKNQITISRLNKPTNQNPTGEKIVSVKF